MKRSLVIILSSLLATTNLHSQDTVRITLPDTVIHNFHPKNRLPATYKTSWGTDLPIVVGGVGLTYLGTVLINNKKDLTTTELAKKTWKNVPSFDRGNAGYYSEKANDDSYIPFHASFVMPLAILALNKNEKRVASQVLVMYLETMGITGTLFTMAAGNIHRSRPLVYLRENGTANPLLGSNVAEIDAKRRDAKNQRSFFAGHTAATAAASFYAAKVFHDLNPNSKLRPYLWGLSAAMPALVGYLRYKGGYHFLSDNILGYVIGAASGILVPEFHKSKKLQNISLTPQIGNGYKGVAFTYHIK